jgi:hypothetical protein
MLLFSGLIVLMVSAPTAHADGTTTLTVIKHVVNSNGGTAAASDWTMSVTGTNPSPGSFAGSESGTVVTLDVGSYNVTESGGPAGYAVSRSVDCEGTIVLGETKTCTITNDDIGPTLAVIKKIINNNGGTGTLASFTPLKVDATEVTNGTKTGFPAGVHTVSETLPSGYAATFSGACNGVSTVTLAVGDDVTCTITNDDIGPQLTVIKKIINNYGGTAVLANFLPLKVDGTIVINGTATGFNAGTYTVSETLAAGYAATFSGACNALTHQVTLAIGEDKTCTITNDNVPSVEPVNIPEVLVHTHNEIKVKLNYRSNTYDSISSGVQVAELLIGTSSPTPIIVLVTSPINLPHYDSTGYYMFDYTPTSPLAPGEYQVWFFLWTSMPSDGGEWHPYMVKVVVNITIT